MFSVHQAASIFYYLGTEPGQESESALFDKKPVADGDYYALQSSDPLAIPAQWAGQMAKTLGYEPGSTVKQEALAALWFGVNPADGKTPLNPKWPTIAQQHVAQVKIARAESRLDAARRNHAHAQSPEDKERSKQSIQTETDALHEARRDPHHRQDAHDCTFSAPKGVSILWAKLKSDGARGDDSAKAKAAALEAAMLEATRATIDQYIEPMLIFTRKRLGKNVDYDNVKGVAAALFAHFDARPVDGAMPDPQMHVHALLMSMGLDHDDQAQAIWTTFLGSHAKAVGAAFRGELASRLRSLGYTLQANATDKIVGFDLAGVNSGLIDEFSARAKQIESAVERGSSAQEAKVRTRSSKGAYGGAELLEDWGQRMDKLQLSAKALGQASLADLALQEAEAELGGRKHVTPGSDLWNRQLAAAQAKALQRLTGKAPSVEEAIEQLLSMKSSISLTDIEQLAFEASQHCELQEGLSAIQWALEFKSRILRHPDLQLLTDTDRYWRPQFTSKALIARERELYDHRLPLMLAPRLDALALSAVDAAIAASESNLTHKNGEPFKLMDFQKSMVREIALSPGSLHVVLAPAGCGKTTSAYAAALAFKSQGFRVRALAPSNKAAQQLAKDMAMDGSEGLSPHQLLIDIQRGKTTLTSKDVIFCDEASMLDFEISDKLTQAILSAEGGPARLVLIGDTEQLPSVARGNFFRETVEIVSNPSTPTAPSITKVTQTMADWTRIARQRSSLGKQATAFFSMGAAARALDIYERMGALNLSATKEDAIASMATDAMRSIAGAAADRSEALTAWQTRSLPLSDAIESTLGRLSRDGRSTVSHEEVISAMEPSAQAAARQWFEDRKRLDRSSLAMIQSCSSILMIATKRSDVARLNAEARKTLSHLGVLGGPDGTRRHWIRRGALGRFEICEGERLIFTAKADAIAPGKGNRSSRVAKSTIGTVVGIAPDPVHEGRLRLTLRLDGHEGKTLEINTAEFDQFDYAYALTAHASQGATAKRVYELFSDFAAKETNYVAKSRHQDSLAFYGVASEYELYKKRASTAIEKSDAKDHAFFNDHYLTSDEEWLKLDAIATESQADVARRSDLIHGDLDRRLVQGALVGHGKGSPTGTGEPNSYFVELDIGWKTVKYWGKELEELMSRFKPQVDDHIGLEALSDRRANGETMHWRFHSAEILKQAGLFMNEDALLAKSDALAGDVSLRQQSMSTLLPSKAPTAHKDAAELMMKALKESIELASQALAERARVAESSATILPPSDLEDRVATATVIEARSPEPPPLHVIDEALATEVPEGLDARAQAAWDRIEARLQSAWGLVYMKASHQRQFIDATEVPSTSALLRTTLKGKAIDVVRWDERILTEGSDDTRQWQLSSDLDASGQRLSPGARRLAGIVLHKDDHDVYVYSHQRVVAIPLDPLGLSDAEDGPIIFAGDEIDIHFSPEGVPSTHSIRDNTLFKRAQSLNSGQVQLNVPSQFEQDVFNLVWQRREGIGPLSNGSGQEVSMDQFHRQAWAEAETHELAGLVNSRRSGTASKIASALPIEALTGSAYIPKATVVEVGPKGVLLSSQRRGATEFYWADRSTIFSILGQAKMASGQKIGTLYLQDGTNGGVAIDVDRTLDQSKSQGRGKEKER